MKIKQHFKTFWYFVGALLFLVAAELIANLGSNIIFTNLGVYWSFIILLACIMFLFLIFKKQVCKLVK